jgi:hypothetical protein
MKPLEPNPAGARRDDSGARSTPHGHLGIVEAREGLALEPIQASRFTSAFAKGAGRGLLCLGADEVGPRLPTELSYWREFAVRHLAIVCALPDFGEDNGWVKPALPRRKTRICVNWRRPRRR